MNMPCCVNHDYYSFFFLTHKSLTRWIHCVIHDCYLIYVYIYIVHNCLVTCPIYQSECQTKGSDGYAGPVHAVIGNAGQRLDFHTLSPDVEAFTVHYAEEFGYSTIHVQGDQTLDFKVYGEQPATQGASSDSRDNIQFHLHYEVFLDRT